MCGCEREDVRQREGRCAAMRGIQNDFATAKAFVKEVEIEQTDKYSIKI